MNNPQPVPASTTNVAPTVGSLIGGAVGLLVASKLNLNPLDPVTGGPVVVSIGTVMTALFHWLGKLTGMPGLG